MNDYKWTVEVFIPCEGSELADFYTAEEALVFAKKETKSGWCSATIRPYSSVEYEVYEFEKAIDSGEIS